mgnify:CR=1 FL=1
MDSGEAVVPAAAVRRASGGALIPRRKSGRAWLARIAGLALLVLPQVGVASESGEISALLRQRDPGAAAVAVQSGGAERTVADLLKRPLTADSAVRIALLSHGSVRAAIADSDAARALLLQASLPANPEVEVSLRVPHDSAQPLQADLGVDLELSSLLLLPLRRSAAQSELTVARLQAAADVLAVAYRARIAYFDAAARVLTLGIRRQALEVAEASYAARAELFRVGNIPAVDLHLERAALAAARLAQNDAERAAAEARERLNAALGLDTASPAWSLSLDGLTAPAGFEAHDAEARAVAASLELLALRSGATAAEGRARLARSSALLPDLKAGFHGERDGTVWELGGHFSLSLPLFNQGQGAVLAQRHRATSLLAQRSAAEARLRAQVRTALARLSLGIERVRLLREGVVPAREQALRELQLQYNGMQVSLFQLLDARRALVEAQQAQVSALAEAQQARATLDALLAGLTPSAPAAAAAAGAGPGADSSSDAH